MARLQKYASTPAVVADAGMVRNFRLAMDELYVRDPETGKGKGVTVASASDLAALMAQMEKVQSETGLVPELVMYEDGVERNEFTRRVVTRELMLESDSQATADQAAKSASLVFQDAPAYAPGKFLYLAESSTEALAAWTQLEEQKIVSSSLLLARQQSKRAMPNDPYVSKQWHLKFANQSGAVAGTDVNIDTVWSYPTSGAGQRGRGIYVGIIDDGLQTAHPDLAANVDTNIDKDWNGGDADPNPGTGDDHGTACAGNVAAVGNNGVGVSGTAPEAKLVGMRLISAAAGDAAEAEAMTYHSTVGQIIHILSNSWGPNDDGLTLEGPGTLTVAALKSAVETGRNGKGTIITWAGGNGGDVNDNSNYDGYANSIYTIAVGAFDSQSHQAYYSEPGANLVICAPSDGSSPALGITTVDRSGAVGYNTGTTSGEISDANYTQTFGGTSSATPTVSGIIALILEANPNLGWRDVQEILMRSAKKVNQSDTDWKTPVAPDNINHNHKFGAGLIDATAAVEMAKIWLNLGKQQSVVSPPASLSGTIPDNSATGVSRSFDFSSINLRVEHVTVKVSVGTVPKGELEVTLTSPSGTVSRLSEKHSDTTNLYTDWTFMTVRNWGENSRGTWTLKVADRTSGTVGTLTAAEMTIYGTGNPPPSVTLTPPASVASGTNVTLTANATDFTADGSMGEVSSVQFFQGATPLGIATLNSGSYTFNWNNPLAGNYSITAQASDREGAVGVSAPVLFTVLFGNGWPVISSLSTTSASVGSSVVLTGSNFVDVSGVAFSGTPAASFTVDSTTQITAVVPSGAATGFITVTNGFGSGTSSSAFTVTQLPVLISQIYGAGGNTGATYNSDYVEIYNRSASPVNLSGWSVQYASSTGISWSSAALSGTIGAGKYFLLKLAGGTIGAALPTPDFTPTTSINMSGTSGKVALMNSTTALTGSSPLGVSGLQDFVGYGTANAYEGSGPAPGGSSTLAVLRQGGGLTDTGNNVADFSTEAPNPRNSNSGSVFPPVISSSSLTATGTVGTEFSYQIAASGSPTSYAATGLPAGLSVSTSTGAITGTPTVAATSNVTISATNASGTGSATLVITISSSGGGGGASGLIAGWDFQTTTSGGTAVAAVPSCPTTLVANFGSGTLYLNGLNGSSTWITTTTGNELSAFGGSTVNAGVGFSSTTSGVGSLAMIGGTGFSANGKKMVFKFSMSGCRDLVVSYATQRSGTGFTTHQWETSLDGSNWTTAETKTITATSFSLTTLQTITSLDNASTAYLRLTVTGATNSTGNNRLDNIQLNATAVVAGPTFASWAGEGVAITPELLMKYAIGGAANSLATGELPVVGKDGSNLTLTAVVRKDSTLTIVGQAVSNLEDYGTPASVTSLTGTSEGVSQIGVPTDCERRIFKSTLTGNRSFLRISVQK